MGLPSKGLPRGCSWVCPARGGLPRGCRWVCPARVYLEVVEAVGGSAQQGFTYRL